jgi:hypothetical protein
MRIICLFIFLLLPVLSRANECLDELDKTFGSQFYLFYPIDKVSCNKKKIKWWISNRRFISLSSLKPSDLEFIEELKRRKPASIVKSEVSVETKGKEERTRELSLGLLTSTKNILLRDISSQRSLKVKSTTIYGSELYGTFRFFDNYEMIASAKLQQGQFAVAKSIQLEESSVATIGFGARFMRSFGETFKLGLSVKSEEVIVPTVPQVNKIKLNKVRLHKLGVPVEMSLWEVGKSAQVFVKSELGVTTLSKFSGKRIKTSLYFKIASEVQFKAGRMKYSIGLEYERGRVNFGIAEQEDQQLSGIFLVGYSF